MDKQTGRTLLPRDVYKRRQHRVDCDWSTEQIETGQTGQEPCCQGKKQEPKISWGPLFSWLLDLPTLTPPRINHPFFFLIKLSYNTGPPIASNFCCSETELRKLHALLIIPVLASLHV